MKHFHIPDKCTVTFGENICVRDARPEDRREKELQLTCAGVPRKEVVPLGKEMNFPICLGSASEKGNYAVIDGETVLAVFSLL